MNDPKYLVTATAIAWFGTFVCGLHWTGAPKRQNQWAREHEKPSGHVYEKKSQCNRPEGLPDLAPGSVLSVSP